MGDTFRVDAAVVANAAFDGQNSTPAPGPLAPVATQRRGLIGAFTGAGMLPVAAAAGSEVAAVGTPETTAAAAAAAAVRARAASLVQSSAAATTARLAAASIGGGAGPGCVIGGAVSVRSTTSRSK